MGVLWCGGEDLDFVDCGTVGWVTDSGFFRSSYVRGAVYGLAVPHNLSAAFPGGSVTSCWLHFQFGLRYQDSDAFVLGLGKVGTTKGLWVKYIASTGVLRLSKWDGTTENTLQTATVSNTVGSYGAYPIDMQVTSHGASANVKVYSGPVKVIDFDGDTTLTDFTAIDCVVLKGYSGYGSGQTRYALASEIIVADEDTRTMSLVALVPVTGGDANAWSGTYADVDDSAINDADVMYENTVDDEAQLALSDMPSGTFAIKAVKIAARCCKSSDATATEVALGVKSGGSIDAGSDIALDTAWATKERLMTQNPVTSAAWALSEINPLQLNLKARS